jgi:hypothetical protein
MAASSGLARREAARSAHQPEARDPRRHLIIAGTGRAGTSFLVRYFTELGLDTILARKGEAAEWDLDANAGLENLALGNEDEDLPYVIKSPWIGEYVDKLLEERRYKIDAFIVPVRDLVEAATSRVVVEQRAIHQNNPWMAERLDKSWETSGHTPGGVVFSLNPLDQARLLAIQFHQLVLKVSEAGVPLIFPVFPKIVTDWEYLHRCLEPIFPTHITKEIARCSHARVADAAKVRVTREIFKNAPSNVIYTNELHMGPRYPSSTEIDVISLRREICQLREELSSKAQAGQRETILESTIQELRSKLARKSMKNRLKQLFRFFGGEQLDKV